jgi:hypothetical protein
LHDRDSKFCDSFRSVLASGGVKTILLPPKSPNLNAFAERWVRSVKQECLSQLMLFGEASLSRVLTEYCAHYHHERNHQGKGNLLLFQSPRQNQSRQVVRCATTIVWADSSNTMSVPHEYFDYSATGSVSPTYLDPSRAAIRNVGYNYLSDPNVSLVSDGGAAGGFASWVGIADLKLDDAQPWARALVQQSGGGGGVGGGGGGSGACL